LLVPAPVAALAPAGLPFHDGDMQTSTEQAARLLRLATVASVSVAVTLILAKSGAWWLSGSVSLLATLIDSLLDAAASLLNLVAVHHALSPADREHRFGHGKAEALAGLGQSVFILGSAVFLLIEAIRRLVEPVVPEALGPGLAVMGFSIVLTLGLLGFQRHVVRMTGSTAIQADALHYRTDLLVNAAVALALGLSAWGWPGFDALFAGLIALYILRSAWDILRQSFDHLMDRELPDADRARIIALAGAHPEVRGLHDLRTRRSGIARFIQLHVELDDHLPLIEAHRISDEVVARVVEDYPGAEVIIHIDPVSVAPFESTPEYPDSAGEA
jgi:ferrous-iron efflux pump FieF